jgi:hypothetical protein
MTSCQSVKVVYVDRYIIPDYDTPIFPVLDREINKDEKGNEISWTIPKKDIDELSKFYIKYDLFLTIYNHDKELFEKTKDATRIE